jgi:hypothetical protein
MKLNQVLITRLSKKIGIPEEKISIPFIEAYFAKHHKELHRLNNESEVGGNVSSIYLRHLPTNPDYLHQLEVGEEKFMHRFNDK